MYIYIYIYTSITYSYIISNSMPKESVTRAPSNRSSTSAVANVTARSRPDCQLVGLLLAPPSCHRAPQASGRHRLNGYLA